MSDELDLNVGDPSRADSASERRRKRREGAGPTATETRAEAKIENEVRTQVGRAFDGLAKNRYTSGDIELGDAITEESDAMTDGFVTLTSNVTPLRMPVIIILNLLITLLAFGRVGGIVLTRVQARRHAAQEEEGSDET